MDKLKFYDACNKIKESSKSNKGIGTLSEKKIHAVLKQYFEPHSDNHEIKVGGFVADIVGEKGIIEIQTRNFKSLRKKLEAFLNVCDVTVVYPIVQVKHITWINTNTGEVTQSRSSSLKPCIYRAFQELHFIRDYIENERLHVCVVMLNADEIRHFNGKSKRKRDYTSDRFPTDIIDEIYFDSANEFAKLIPDELHAAFTSSDLAKAVKIPLSVSQNALYFMNHIGAVKRIGKKGNSYIYTAEF